jgi:ribosome-binding protein aMBF1 (putative translation factor)
MADKPFQRVHRPTTPEEQARHAAIREAVREEFPPAEESGPVVSPPGIPAQIRQAREARGLTWYALARLAGLPSSDAVRDIEHGRDAPLSTVQAVARALGMTLELKEARV